MNLDTMGIIEPLYLQHRKSRLELRSDLDASWAQFSLFWHAPKDLRGPNFQTRVSFGQISFLGYRLLDLYLQSYLNTLLSIAHTKS